MFLFDFICDVVEMLFPLPGSSEDKPTVPPSDPVNLILKLKRMVWREQAKTVRFERLRNRHIRYTAPSEPVEHQWSLRVQKIVAMDRMWRSGKERSLFEAVMHFSPLIQGDGLERDHQMNTGYWKEYTDAFNKWAEEQIIERNAVTLNAEGSAVKTETGSAGCSVGDRFKWGPSC
jgi:hypothetical protein